MTLMVGLQTLSKGQWKGRTHGRETTNFVSHFSQKLIQRLSHDEIVKEKIK